MNAFWQSHSIRQMIDTLDGDAREQLVSRLEAINDFYNDASARYQEGKGARGIPFA